MNTAIFCTETREYDCIGNIHIAADIHIADFICSFLPENFVGNLIIIRLFLLLILDRISKSHYIECPINIVLIEIIAYSPS